MKKFNNFSSFLLEHNLEHSEALYNLSKKELYNFSENIYKSIIKKSNIFICGNGGSWSIANHALCDFNKNLYLRSKKKIIPKFVSLSTNFELSSAISNDIDYSDIFSFQLKNFASKKDSLLIISSSGNSKNVIKALNYAKKINMKIFSLTGFNGGLIKKKSDFNINVNSQKYPIIEDLHQYIIHFLIEYYLEINDK